MIPKSPHISKQFLTTMTFCQFWFGMKGSYHTRMRDKPTYVCAKQFSFFFKVAMDRIIVGLEPPCSICQLVFY